MKHRKGFAAWLLLMLYAPALYAQFTIEVQSVETAAFPDLTANVVVRHSGVIMRDTDSSHFTVREDGFARIPLHLTHPIPTKNFSLTIVIGVGSTMSAGDIAFAKGVANRLVERLDGVLDEASVITYDDIPHEQQQMTAIKPVLFNRIEAIAPTGRGNALWAGGHAGLSYLLNNSIHPSRTVLILSNGRNDGSTRTVQDVVDLAKTTNIRVHCFGINAVNNDSEMKFLCQETGGTYWNNIDVMVQQLIDDYNGTPAASLLTWTSTDLCRDGFDRSVFTQVKIGTDSAHVTTIVPLAADASGNVSVTMTPDTATVVSGGTKDVALRIVPGVQQQRLHPGTITLAFDTSALRLQSVSTAGNLADGMTATVAMTASGADIMLTGTAALNGSGTLATLTFLGGEVQANTDAQVQVTGASWTRGCLTVLPGAARITVRPRSAGLALRAQPTIFTWDDGSKRYSPDPATVSVEVTNSGDLPLTGLYAELDTSNDVRVAYGASRTVPVIPATLQPGEKGTAVWFVQALPHATEITAQINAAVHSTEGTSAQLRLFMNIKPASSAVTMTCDVDAITIEAGEYTPDPARVRTTITSTGAATGPAGDVTIILPQDVTLDGGPQTQAFAAMPSGESITLQWPLRYPRPAMRTEYPILLVRSATGHADDTCRLMLVVPVLTAARLEGICSLTPDEIDTTVTEATYAVTVRNNGNADAINASVGLILPVGFTFAAGEVATKAVADPLVPGADTTVSWKILPVTRQRCVDETVDIGILINQTGGAAAMCSVPVLMKATGNLRPELRAVSPTALDTLRTNTNVSFDVDVYDHERGAITYAWFVNDVQVGDDARLLEYSFPTEGDHTVRVDVYDPCTAEGGEAVSHTWTVYVYNTTSVGQPAIAADLAILGNYPNPFNPVTVIEYRIPAGRHELRLEVLDALGQVVRTLAAGPRDGGTYRQTFDAAGLPSGSYLVRLRTDQAVRLHWIMLVK
ncbi:MAG: VWA domain-containing protein [Bacteroidota bacterium]|jgi:uncharacterized repeat protein (TIGR01451 family)|nr:VWA domain-containing protein [Bacteroidota bacterium]